MLVRKYIAKAIVKTKSCILPGLIILVSLNSFILLTKSHNSPSRKDYHCLHASSTVNPIKQEPCQERITNSYLLKYSTNIP